jgi:hypothetical protein
MKDDRRTVGDPRRASEAFAAELTEAAYSVAMQHGAGGKWLDLALDLWQAMTETVQKWEQKAARAG